MGLKKYKFGLALFAALLLPQVVTNTYFVTMFCLALIYIIIAFGLNFITGMTGQMNLGTAGIYCLGAYTSALLTTKAGISPWLGLIAVVAMGFLIGVGLGYPSLRLEGVYLSLTTIAFGEVVRLLVNNMTNFTGGAQGVRNIPPFTIFGYAIASKVQNYYFILAFVVLFAIISYRIMHSKWGRAFIAIRDNIEAVETCGIDTAQIKIIAFTLAAIFGCVAGGLYAHYSTYINASTFTLNLSVSFVVMIMVGGIGNMWGCILGAVIVSMLPEFLRFLGEYYQISYSTIILLCAVFLPSGIINTIKRRRA
ncbi:branched-chain amino acid ABC transporter permease [Enterocloster lavalensis]|uniref:Amino acid/amide ABC transporter membrane protein 2, HAAT family n=2 Tax=Lachnospiraceae TaxID=186803 RepID=A0A1I0CNI1_9FIRM|nr:branched-chain amino acid ABC transporter permease [Enterocloster lavalensis]SET21046.1 amino acid/amide ABC transporter membrane protein 2, HAAT family [Enterocloster lavalensis]